MIYMINRPIAHSGFYYKIMLFFSWVSSLMTSKVVCVLPGAKERPYNLSINFFMIGRYVDLAKDQRIYYSDYKIVTILIFGK